MACVVSVENQDPNSTGSIEEWREVLIWMRWVIAYGRMRWVVAYACGLCGPWRGGCRPDTCGPHRGPSGRRTGGGALQMSNAAL
ncbi:hypothetical protein ACLOJK_014937 [Asimina triloba]